MTEYPPGIVVVPTGEMSRFTAFWISLFGLKVPPGSRVSLTQGISIVENLNISIRTMLMPNPEMAWAWIIADDHTFRSDILYRLLAHDKEIVVPLCALRSAPFRPSVYRDTPERVCAPVEWSDIPATGLTSIDGTGYAGGLFKRTVFEKLGDPWWDPGPSGPRAPHWGEDLWFCRKVRNAGFAIWLDPEIHVGHITTCILDPTRTAEGGWGVAADMGHQIVPPTAD